MTQRITLKEFLGSKAGQFQITLHLLLQMSDCKTIGIGLAGFGTVGGGVAKVLERNAELIQGRTGNQFSLDIRKVVVRDINKPRAVNLPAEVYTTEWEDVVNDPSVDIVVELIGGTDKAFDIVKRALELRKPVVTGNKALLAERGAELFALSEKMETPIHFEAAVAGAIPVIKAVQESLVGNQINSMAGIINGTSNYILERMTKAGLGYEEALEEAKDLGYAEADPTLDVNGWDAAHKAILLAMLSYGFIIDPEQVYVRGIENVSTTDIEFADQLGYCAKLLNIVRLAEDGRIEIRTQPSFISKEHMLSNVNGVFNAISIYSDAAGEGLYYGRGAGEEPTASSVIADIVEAARCVQTPNSHRGFAAYNDSGSLIPIEETQTPYYVRFQVEDQPGVLARISEKLAETGLSLSGSHSSVDPNNPDAEFTDIIFTFHTCKFSLLQKGIEAAESTGLVKSTPSVFRIESFNEA